jgi:hypothetical protein
VLQRPVEPALDSDQIPQRSEMAPWDAPDSSYSIASSASIIRESGSVKPIAYAAPH